MKYFPITDSINSEMLDRFIRFYNDYKDDACTIVIHSRGGFTFVAETLVHMINQMPDCTLMIHSAYSAAFELAMQTKCKKILSKFSRGMMHMGRLETSIGVDKKPYYDEDINHTKNFHIEKRIGDVMAKKIMNAAEIKKWKLREEVWFDFKRMKQIFPDAEIIK